MAKKGTRLLDKGKHECWLLIRGIHAMFHGQRLRIYDQLTLHLGHFFQIQYKQAVEYHCTHRR